MGVGTLEEVRELSSRTGMEMSEPVEILGITDDDRTGRPGCATLLGYRPQRIRQLAPAGMVWRERVAAALGIDEQEVLRRLLARDSSLVDDNGLVGIAREIQEAIPLTQAFPLIGWMPTKRGWAFDRRYIDLFATFERRAKGNPRGFDQLHAQENVQRLLSQRGLSSVGAVALKLSMSDQEIIETMDRLVERGLVEHLAGNGDWLARRVRLTPEGWRRTVFLAQIRGWDQSTWVLRFLAEHDEGTATLGEINGVLDIGPEKVVQLGQRMASKRWTTEVPDDRPWADRAISLTSEGWDRVRKLALLGELHEEAEEGD